MRILVTGARGQLGTEIMALLSGPTTRCSQSTSTRAI
jgi:dTDP-4-dehydrorhamnose reductase